MTQTPDLTITRKVLEDKEAMKLLGVSSYAEKTELKKAFFKWSKKYHPDKYEAVNIEGLSDSEKEKETARQNKQVVELFRYVSTVDWK